MFAQTIILQADGGGLMSMLPFILMIGVLYFFMIRPQMARQKKKNYFSLPSKKELKL